MTIQFDAPEAMILGAEQRRLLMASLPSHNSTRWTPARKMQVVLAVVSGVLSLEEAQARYALSVEEFLSWQRMASGRGTRSGHTRPSAASTTRDDALTAARL